MTESRSARRSRPGPASKRERGKIPAPRDNPGRDSNSDANEDVPGPGFDSYGLNQAGPGRRYNARRDSDDSRRPPMLRLNLRYY
jgi:hypothetical protein